MAGFAEWLVLESFLDGLETEVLLERAALDTLSMVARAIRENEEEDEDDGSPAVLDDPFAGGEDADPVEEDPEAKRILDNPVAPREEPDTQKKGHTRPEDHSRELEKIPKALKILKADAIRVRAEEVEKIASFLKELRASIDSDDLSVSHADPADAIPTLAKLGYLGRLDSSGENKTIQTIKSGLSGELRKILTKRRGSRKRLTPNDKKRIKEAERTAREKLMEALEAAGKEEGNDPPQGGFPSQEEVRRANEDFMVSIGKVLGGRFRTLARGQKLGNDRVGHMHYEPEDLSNQMVLGLLKHFTTRKWSGPADDRSLMPWSHNDYKLNMNPKDMLAYLMGTAKKEPKRAMEAASRQLSPRSKQSVKSSIKNIEAKSRIIGEDLKSGNLGFYIKYLNGAKLSPLRSRNPKDEVVQANDKHDRLRARIMLDIEREADKGTPDISLDPNEIRRTLNAFVHLRLAPQYRQVVHASTLAGDDESPEDAVLSGSERRKDDAGAELSHSVESDDEFGPEEENPMDAGQAASNASSSMLFDSLKPFIVKAINDIANGYVIPSRPTGAQGGPREALALCIKFGIPCNVTTKEKNGSIVPATVSALGQGSLVLDDRLKDLFRQASEREGWSWEAVCRTAFQNHGINHAAGGRSLIASKWSQYPLGSKDKLTPRSAGSMHEYLNGATSGPEPSPGGLAKLCGRMEELIRF